MMRPFLFLAIAFCLAGKAYGFGPKTEEQKKEDRIFKCLIAFASADSDSDKRISREEFSKFEELLSESLFDEPIEEDLGYMYDDLVATSLPPPGVADSDEIDIFGADLFGQSYIGQDRIDALESICHKVIVEMAKHGHETDPPMMVAAEIIAQLVAEEQEEEDEVEETAGGTRNLRG